MKKTNEVSKLAGVSRRTLQYYDDKGVLVAGRSENNHRLYDEKALCKIWQIMIYKEMGLKLKEIRQLFRVSEDQKKEYLRLRVETVEGEIGKLKEQIEFIALVLEHGMPQIPEELSDMTYMKSIEKIKKKLNTENAEKETQRYKENRYGWQGLSENRFDRSEPDRTEYSKKYYAGFIKQLRRRLDEAYQQLQQGQFRYTLHDTYTVMGETIKLIVQHTNGTDYIGNDVLQNMKICEREGLLGEDEGFMDRLHEVFYICRMNEQEFSAQDDMNFSKVRFAVMQIKDLLNFAEKLFVRV